MTALEKLERLKAQVRSYAKLDHEDVWNVVRTWKGMAKEAIRTIFCEYEGCSSFEEKIDHLFNPFPVASTGMVPLLTTSVKDIARKFQEDIISAAAIMDECIKTLEKIYERYNPQRESFQDDTHEQMVVDYRKNHTSVVKDVDGSVVANRPTLSREASITLDAVMDAEDSRFEETDCWN